MINRHLLLILLVVFINSLLAQKTNTIGNLNAETLLSKLKLLRRNTNDSALNYANYVIGIARSTKDTWLEPEATMELARIYFTNNDQIKSLETAMYAESISTPKNPAYFQAPEYIAYIQNRQGKTEEALQNLFKALRRSDSADMKTMIASINITIADVYRENANSPKALDYARKALQIITEKKDTLQLLNVYSLLGNIYSNSDYRTAQRLDTAINFYQKIMVPPFTDHWFKPFDSARHFLNMGRLYGLQGKNSQAKLYLNIALEITERKQFKSLLQSTKNEILTLELRAGNNKEAKNLAIEAKLILPNEQTSIKRIQELDNRTQEASEGLGDYKTAYTNLLASNIIKDSLFNLQKLKTVTDIEKKYERDKKVLLSTNLLLKKENERDLIFFLSLFVIIFVTAGFIWINYKRRLKNRYLSTLIHEVNHRTKNNLQMLSSLITGVYQNIEDDTLKAEIKKLRSYVKSFGLMYDNLNKTASFDDVNISEYTENISKSVIGNKDTNQFDFVYNAESNIHIASEKAILIGLIINELITNSIKYAFSVTSSANTISIHLYKEKMESLHIIYEDSGQGYSKEASKKGSFGLHMVNQLIKQLKGTIEFDTFINKKVIIQIPI